MKQITLNLRKTLLLVELPEDDVAREPYGFDQTHIYACHDPIVYHLKKYEGEDHTRSFNVDGFWQHVGSFPSISESYWEGVVDLINEAYFENYQDPSDCYMGAKDSVISAIKAEGWYVDENPYGIYKAKNTPKEELDNEYQSQQLWQESQSRVISLNRMWVFERKEVEA